MKLVDLAKHAAKLPDLDFEWAGPEQFSDMNFAAATGSHQQLRDYVDKLRRRMAEQSMAIDALANGYRQLRDIILEAEIDAERSK